MKWRRDVEGVYILVKVAIIRACFKVAISSSGAGVLGIIIIPIRLQSHNIL